MSKPETRDWLVLGMVLGLLGARLAAPPPVHASCSRLECTATDCLRTAANSCLQFKYSQADCIYEVNGPMGNGKADKYDGGMLLKNNDRPAMCSPGGSCSATMLPAFGSNCMPTRMEWSADFNRKECCNDTSEVGCNGC